jgi:hypothetical protein
MTDPAEVSIWFSVLTPGLIGAGVTALVYTWVQRPRADVRLQSVGLTVIDLERLQRAKTNGQAAEAQKHWGVPHCVRLSNYGDGAAYDIELTGTECRPRVWIDDLGAQDGDDEPYASWPMWSNKLSVLGPGESVTVLVMGSPDQSRPKPVLIISWPRLPRRGLGRVKRTLDLADAPSIESGWPGNKDL